MSLLKGRFNRLLRGNLQRPLTVDDAFESTRALEMLMPTVTQHMVNDDFDKALVAVVTMQRHLTRLEQQLRELKTKM